MYCRKKTAPPKNAPLSLHDRDQGAARAAKQKYTNGKRESVRVKYTNTNMNVQKHKYTNGKRESVKVKYTNTNMNV